MSGDSEGQDCGTTIGAICARNYDSLADEFRQSAAHGRKRAQFQKKKLLRREHLLLLLRISNLDDDIEVDERFEERQFQSFEFPDFPQRCEQLYRCHSSNWSY